MNKIKKMKYNGVLYANEEPALLYWIFKFVIKRLYGGLVGVDYICVLVFMFISGD